VLDWELSTLGDPAADFTYHLLMYRMPSDLFAGLAGMDLDSLGIPSEAKYVAAYCRRTGRESLRNKDYLVVFNLFRLAAILHGIRGRIVRGTASSSHAVETASKLEPLAELAWAEAQKRTFPPERTGISGLVGFQIGKRLVMDRLRALEVGAWKEHGPVRSFMQDPDPASATRVHRPSADDLEIIVRMALDLRRARRR
jgi:hypothetical protein